MEKRTLLPVEKIWPLLLAVPLWFGCSAEEKKPEAPPVPHTKKAISFQNQKRVLESRSMQAQPPAAPAPPVNALHARLDSITGKTYPGDDEIKAKAEKGDAAAQVLLARKAMEEGNPDEAAKWLRKAADQGNADGQRELGHLKWGDGDFLEAMKWYRQSAAQGDADAQHRIGVMFTLGYGVEKDYVEAVKWFHQSALQGDPQSQFSLGLRYANGEGVEKDFAQSVKWLSLSSEQGITVAQQHLAQRYADGEGVAQDKIEAYKWYVLAAYDNDPERIKKRDAFAQDLTPEQIVSGKDRAAVFVPKKTGN
jgi:tetratricopeptide (TPR) repeat protein